MADISKISPNGGTTVYNLKDVTARNGLTATEALLRDTVGWTGKNLIPYPYITASKTIQGIAYTVNSNGTIAANGTATADSWFSVTKFTAGSLKAGNYILNGCPSGGGSGKYMVHMRVDPMPSSGTYFRIDNYSGDTEFSITDTTTDYIVFIGVKSGQTVSNLVFAPMIRRANILDGTFEIGHTSVSQLLTDLDSSGNSVRVYNGDIPGSSNSGTNSTCTLSNIIPSTRVKVNDVVIDQYVNSGSGYLYLGFWKITGINGSTVSVTGIKEYEIPTGGSGVNLLLGTGTSQTKSSMTMSTDNTYTTWDPYSMKQTYAEMALNTSQYVTVSFDWSATSAPANATVRVGTGASPWEYFGTLLTLASGSSSGHKTATYKVTDTLKACTSKTFRLRFDNAAGMNFTILNVKLEIGKYPTPWTPNQADLVGPAAGFGTPTATIDSNVGTPSVTVTASGGNTSKVFNFAFKNLKGAKGDKGDKGDTGSTGAAAGFGTPTASVDSNIGTPSVTITSSGANTAKVFNFAFKNLKGAKGDKGDKGDTGSVNWANMTTAQKQELINAAVTIIENDIGSTDSMQF